jgi:hypothetical protein
MHHSTATGFTCPKCNTKYQDPIDCLNREFLPECCKNYFIDIDHLHIYDKDMNDFGILRYKRNLYNNLDIILEIENYEGKIKCLCEARELLKELK